MPFGKDDRAKRTSPRRVFRRPVGLLCQGRYAVVQAVQLGEGGIMVEGELDWAVNSLCIVTLLLPDGINIVTRAQILYLIAPDGNKSSPSFGLQFVDLPLPKRRLIRNFVAAKTEQETESEREVSDFLVSGKREAVRGTKG